VLAFQALSAVTKR